ncbi:MAG: hypothetical protein EAX95_13765 [Candidatus Thorarchaeota archaeon]|nr:hypothetical protein [Candidatus Thorarchaeota archaeon]
MASKKSKSVLILVVLLASTAAGIHLGIGSLNIEPLEDHEISSLANGKGILIINDPRKYAFFGWYRPTQFSVEILNILNRTVLWASSYASPEDVDIVFFSESGDSYAAFVSDWLVSGGYLSDKIEYQTSANIEEFNSDYYEGIDLVIYWNRFGYDPTNVVESHVPFITVSTTQTDEMGIAEGLTTVSGSNETIHVVDNGYYPTEHYPLGPVLLDDSYSFEAAQASSIGKVLIASDVESVTTQVKMSMVQNVTILPNGSASVQFTITIPESPLAEIFRESFFEDPLTLEQGIEYEIPENIAFKPETSREEAIKDVVLLGDVGDADGQVEMDDLNLIADHIGIAVGDSNWNSTFDLNHDGKIDMKDLAIAAHNLDKTENNTGTLFVTGYYDGILVNLTEVYYRGPEGSPRINVSESGYAWYHLLPGTYTIFGTYNGIEKSIVASIGAKQVTYAQLDFGGAPPPPVQQNQAPVREPFYEGVSMEQLILLGFDIGITDSGITPLSVDNGTEISLVGYSPLIAEIISYPDWQIKLGPTDENTTSSAAEFIFTKIQYMMLLLQSIPGKQIYTSEWQIAFELPGGSMLQDQAILENLNWTIDFGEGTILNANVTVGSGRVIVNELLVVTEGNITASEEYLTASFGNYRMFSINYTYSGPVYQAQRDCIQIGNDWSKTWSYAIAPGGFQKAISAGPFWVTLSAKPTLNVNWFMGWERKWTRTGYKLQWFESWMKIAPSIRVEASAGVSAGYTFNKEYVLWTWSTRFTFWAGAVVVWANLKLTVSVGVVLDAYGQLSISTWAEANAWYKAGVRWQDGWSTIWDRGSGASYGKPTITAAAGVVITPYAKCRLAFLLYDVGGPFVEAVALAPIGIEVSASQAGISGTWAIALKLKVNVGVTLAGWITKILKLSEYSKTVAEFTLMSWEGTWL